MVVMEIGFDDDVDQDLRDQIEEHTGEELIDEDSDKDKITRKRDKL